MTPVSASSSAGTPSSVGAASQMLAVLPPTVAPALTNTGQSWTPIVSRLITYGQWLLANPGNGNTANVSTITVSGRALDDHDLMQVADLLVHNAGACP